MKTTITDKNYTLYNHYLQERDYDSQERLHLRQNITRHIKSFFHWEDYDSKYTHLVYYAELHDHAYAYVNGFLMTEEEFDELIANREGIGFVGAFHKGTASFKKSN